MAKTDIRLNMPVKMVEDISGNINYAVYAQTLDDKRVVEYVRDGDILHINHANLRDGDVLVLPQLDDGDNVNVSFEDYGFLKNVNLTIVVPNRSVKNIFKYAPINLRNQKDITCNIDLVLPKQSFVKAAVAFDSKETGNVKCVDLMIYNNSEVSSSEHAENISLFANANVTSIGNIGFKPNGEVCYYNGKIIKKPARMSDILEEKGFN